MIRQIPFTKKQIEKVIKKYPTPFLIYDEKGIRQIARRLNKAFEWVVGKGFKNYFAVKACPNPYILEILKQENFGVDCSSLPELMLAEKTGIIGEEIMFSSNDTPQEEFKKARELGAIINLDDITHTSFLEKCAGIPEIICFRYNPGSQRTGNEIIGDPKEAKYGLTRTQLFEGYKIMKEKGVKRFGLHTMIVSNMLDSKYLIQTADMLFELVAELSKKLNIKFEFVNLGGGIGVDYKPEEKPVDIEFVSNAIKKLYEEKIITHGFAPLKIVMECGRVITGPYGFLVSKVRHVVKKYKNFVGLDSSMVDFMRPATYRAYHHISVLGKENLLLDHIYDVHGSLCENNDKFAIDRPLPEIEVDDIITLHDAGAHGRPMGSNYNGKLRCKELLLKENGEVELIRRAETEDDYFSTLSFPNSKFF
ncbi:diaminopimelate decarboxylase [Patescibacteria group bacterium]|nr:diaminopimelate decarboxylase [Patescibacteria group bacterium]